MEHIFKETLDSDIANLNKLMMEASGADFCSLARAQVALHMLDSNHYFPSTVEHGIIFDGVITRLCKLTPEWRIPYNKLLNGMMDMKLSLNP